MSRQWRLPALVIGGLLIVSTPLVWLLGNPDTGQFVAASVQGATGAASLLAALFPPRTTPDAGATDVVVDTGRAGATGGGRALTGIRRPQGTGNGSARAERTGDATADGSGSSANSGIDHS